MNVDIDVLARYIENNIKKLSEKMLKLSKIEKLLKMQEMEIICFS